MQVSAINSSVGKVNFQGHSAKDFDKEVIDISYQELPEDDFYASEELQEIAQTTALAAKQDAELKAQSTVNPSTVIFGTGALAATFALFKGKVMPPCRKVVVKLTDTVVSGALKLLKKTSILNQEAFNKVQGGFKDKFIQPLMSASIEKPSELIQKFDAGVQDIFSESPKVADAIIGFRQKAGVNNVAGAIDALGAGIVAHQVSDISADRVEEQTDKHKVKSAVTKAVKGVLDAAEQAGIAS